MAYSTAATDPNIEREIEAAALPDGAGASAGGEDIDDGDGEGEGDRDGEAAGGDGGDCKDAGVGAAAGEDFGDSTDGEIDGALDGDLVGDNDGDADGDCAIAETINIATITITTKPLIAISVNWNIHRKNTKNLERKIQENEEIKREKVSSVFKPV